MTRLFRPAAALLIALSLAACAAQSATPDLTPPPLKRPDAKTTLENHR